MNFTINIKPEKLHWAINRAGVDLGTISEKSKHLSKWLSGEKNPTLRQLEEFARQVHVPFGYLFLDSVPDESLPFPFFRTVGNVAVNPGLNLYDTVQIILQRQQWIIEYLTEDETPPLPFVGRYTENDSVLQVVHDIRTTLNLKENWAKDFPTWEEAKDHLSQVIEDAGIFITFNSIVGNNTHRKISVDECRGFVLVDALAPCMFINAADSKSAQMFTLAHELAHIWIGKSAGFDLQNLQPADTASEIFCDKVAAELLVPAHALNDVWRSGKNIENLARYFKVSKIVIARRLLDCGFIARDEFLEFYKEHNAQFNSSGADSKSGGDFYRTQRKRLGLRFMTFVNQAVREQKLLLRDAYDLTKMNSETFHRFMREHLN